jgi:alkylation response protein AidB-like acyl-CoA dehydrogenase
LVARIRAVAAVWDRANGHEDFPAERLAELGRLGALAAFTTVSDEDATKRLLVTLRLGGGADLSLGRVFEGHVNAVQLIRAYGGADQHACSREIRTRGIVSAFGTPNHLRA